jgi:hypothetical protein
MMPPSQEGALPLLSVPRLLHHLVQLVWARPGVASRDRALGTARGFACSGTGSRNLGVRHSSGPASAYPPHGSRSPHVERGADGQRTLVQAGLQVAPRTGGWSSGGYIMSTGLKRKQHDPLVTHHKHEPTSRTEGCSMATERVVIPGIVKNGIVVP